jgi:hypothetical protein
MNTNVFVKGKTWLLMFLFLFIGVIDARADIELADDLIITGYVRQMLAYHVTHQNPNNAAQEDNNWANLSRTHFQTELTYRPNVNFKLFAKMRFIWDSTESLDSELLNYDAFPLSTPHYGTTLRAGHDDNVIAEIWELYADLDIGRLWLRLGKQQIAWGELFGWRVLDIINPLDMSWHFRFEPEEYENIRIPQWLIRARYKIEQTAVPWLEDLYIEGFLNPGDIIPNIYPEPYAPYRISPSVVTGPPSVTNEIDRRGEEEYGFRLGYSIGRVSGTLNYLYLYSDDARVQNVSPPGPPPFTYENRYPQIDVYGITLNYAFDAPINVVASFEGKYTDDQPYYVGEPIGSPPSLPSIEPRGEWNYAIQLQRNTFVFPRPVSAMNISVQFNQTIVQGDNDTIKSTPAPHGKDTNAVDKRKNLVGLNMQQFWWYNQIMTSFKVLYDLDGAYSIGAGFKYRHGDHWYFGIYPSFYGGSNRRPGFGSTWWADEIYCRITYQF